VDFDAHDEVDEEEFEDDLGTLPPEFFKLPIAKILYPKTHDNPHMLLRDMAVAPSHAAWYIHQMGEAERELMEIDAEYEQWYAHAYEFCRQILDEEADGKAAATRTTPKIPTATAIKLSIPIECDVDEWELRINGVAYPHESWSAITARRIAAKSKAFMLRGFCKTIEMKINMLPSQLSMAKELYKAPNVGAPNGVTDSE
jgi:hypothetical protein